MSADDDPDLDEELADLLVELRRDLDNERTANHALRVELAVASARSTAQFASINQLIETSARSRARLSSRWLGCVAKSPR